MSISHTQALFDSKIGQLAARLNAQVAIRFGPPKGNAAENVDTAGFSDQFPVSVALHEA